MIWTVEKRYQRIENVKTEELIELQEKVDKCPWRQLFHIQPSTGLLNDPNGFSYFNGEYHLFYQWFPLGPVHGVKYWYHTKSPDLVNWKNVGIALRPNDFFDSHGAYSGSGIEHEGKLFLLYTGNTRDENWKRHPYQCLAMMDKTGIVTKQKEPVISDIPNGYTDHFRDPKVWKQDGTFYAVIGAQRMNETGCVVLYSSPNLLDWSFEGEIETELDSFGYMWECPDYFEIDQHGVLIFSPQGIEASGDQFHNIYQSGYLIGEKLDLQKKSFIHNQFKELDHGFDFYAPQTTLDNDGRRILVGWMGLPEIEYPTDQNQWAHCLTVPRELQIEDGKLIQKPVKELELLRKKEVTVDATIDNDTIIVNGFSGTQYELICEFTEFNADQFGIELRANEKEMTILKYDTLCKKMILDRTLSGEAVAVEYGTIRKCELETRNLKLQVFVDTSSVEVFVNDGEAVFTSRIFPCKESTNIRFFANNGKVELKAVKWDYQ